MLIKRVVLKNWRSHKETQLEFSKGTNMLVGIMGSGKSSVLEAICFALYGTFPALARKRVKLAQIINENTGTRECSVEVVFEKDGKEYFVKRMISDGKSDAELREGKRMIEAKSEAVTRMVEHILGVDYDMFTKAIYSEQNALDYFLSLNPGDRKKQLDNLIGIDRFELARANSTKLINRLNDEIEELHKKIGTYDKASIIKEREDAEKEVNSIAEKQRLLSEELKSLISKEDEIRKKKENAEQKRRQYETLVRQEVECTAFIGSVESRIRKHTHADAMRVDKEIAALENEEAALRKSLATKEEMVNRIGRKIGELEANIKLAELKKKEYEEFRRRLAQFGDIGNVKETREEAELLRSKLLAAEKEHGAFTTELTLLRRDIANLEGEISASAQLRREAELLGGFHQRTLDDLRHTEASTIEWIASLKEMIKTATESIAALEKEEGGVCPLCDSPLDKKKREMLIAKKREIIENSQKELAENEERLGRLRKEIQEADAGLKRKAEVTMLLQGLEQKEKELREKLEKSKSLDMQVAGSGQKVKTLNEELTAALELVRKAEDAEVLRQKITETESFLSQHMDDDKALESLKTEYEKEIGELSMIRNRLSDVEKSLIKSRNLANEIREDLELQEAVMRRRAQLEAIKESIKNLGYDENELVGISSAYNEVLVKKREIEVNLDNVSNAAEIAKKRVELASKQLAEIEGKENELARMSNAVVQAREFQQSIIETQVLLRSELVNSINSVLEKVWGVIYPYGDLKEVMIEATESDYVLKAKRNSEWIVIEGNVSGGERASAALALRIALSIVLAPNLSMLVLDEPTHNLDENGVKALGEILRERLPNIIEQSFVITHDENLKEGASGRLYVFSRKKEAGEPTQVLQEGEYA
ncbi:MAG: AAA family ATPase [Candidatus Micrarchaeia archaeon]